LRGSSRKETLALVGFITITKRFVNSSRAHHLEQLEAMTALVAGV
jgi:hypothetical protein